MYSLSKAEDIIARALDIPKKRRAALTAEIKYLRRRGFPKLPKNGKGKRTEFRKDQVFSLTTAISLGQLGIQPKVAIQGASLVLDAMHRPQGLPENPFLCISKDEIEISSAAIIRQLVEIQGRATVVSLQGLASNFEKAVAEELSAESVAEDFEILFNAILGKR